MQRTSKAVLVFALAAAATVIGFSSFYVFAKLSDRTEVMVEPGVASLDFGGSRLFIEVASSAAQRKLGLSHRVSLAPDAGMYFPVDPPSRLGFWMKDMNFPLDFIYLYKGRVVEIKENKQPSLTPFPFFPETIVDAVVEVNAGWAAAHGVKVGDPVGYGI